MRTRHSILYALLLGCSLLLTGCYQAQVTTNRTDGDTVVEKKWAASYLNGLVPATLDVSDECPNGIAAAERDFPFLNGLVGAVTLGIYLPQNITVTCAAGGAMSTALPPDAPTAPPVAGRPAAGP
jgi:hypothetical protein